MSTHHGILAALTGGGTTRRRPPLGSKAAEALRLLATFVAGRNFKGLLALPRDVVRGS